MSVDGWNTVLVLGGIRSGKSEFAESLVADAPSVRYVATSVGGQDDPEWLARIDRHQQRRPQAWSTEETGDDPGRLAAAISDAKPDETLLVDDLGGWLTVLLDPAQQPADDTATIDRLAAAVRACTARLVLVSPEVGLSLVPTTPVGRAFADALGTTNKALAEACDEVVLVVAGQPVWLKPAARPTEPSGTEAPNTAATGAAAASVATGGAAAAAGGEPDRAIAEPPVDLPEVRHPTPAAAPVTTDPLGGPTLALPLLTAVPDIEPGMSLPMPDEDAGIGALNRLAGLDLPGGGLGALARAVEFAGATQERLIPQPWRSVRVLVLYGDHEGGSAAGDGPRASARRAAQAAAGDGPLGRLAAGVVASLQVVEAPTAAPIEDRAALDNDRVDAALRLGWRLAEQAADHGVDALILGACGSGSAAGAAAVFAALAGAEPAAVLARVVAPGGGYDDAAWMKRCAAVRDAMHRTRHHPRDGRDTLIELAGGDIAVATGVLLGAASRHVPVLIDGSVGIAAALITRELGGQARHWCLLPDHGGDPGVRLAAEVLGLDPLFDLRLDLGEGATALTVLPMLRTAVTLAAVLPAHPGPEPEEPVEPAGPDGADPDPATGAVPAGGSAPPAHLPTARDAPGAAATTDGAHTAGAAATTDGTHTANAAGTTEAGTSGAAELADPSADRTAGG